MNHTRDSYDKIVKPIEDKHNYNKETVDTLSTDENKKEDEKDGSGMQDVLQDESKKEDKKDSSGKTDILQDTTESKKEDEKDSSGKIDVEPNAAESKKEDKQDGSGKHDVIHDTAESKKEDGKDGTVKQDILHDTSERKKEDEKDRSGKTGHVMISYSWGAAEDHYPCQQRMIKLRDELIAGGYRVWMDLDEMAGNMDDRMAEAVENAYAILMCVSERYQKVATAKKKLSTHSF
ncbi:uncharacterized protein [Amphiura filiformis]|uniref:uncharacterized protein isoform X3 n=1 Tax=Amphiura filiformis TaxID=82378 RepID=UPI003B2283A5